MADEFFIDFRVAGVFYRAEVSNFKQLQIGDELALEPEPSNRYDQDAIKVLFGGNHIGYVPKDSTQYIHAALKSGKTLRVQVDSLKTADNYAHVSVFIVQE